MNKNYINIYKKCHLEVNKMNPHIIPTFMCYFVIKLLQNRNIFRAKEKSMRLTGKRIISLGIITGMFLSGTVLAYNSNNEVKPENSTVISLNSTELSDKEQYTNEENSIENEITNENDNMTLSGNDSADNQSTIDKETEEGNQDKEVNDSKIIKSKNKSDESNDKKNNNNQKTNETKNIKNNKKTSGLIIAQADNYVNIRSKANTNGAIIGKLYDESVGTVLATKGDWLKIKSGCVTGYVNSEFVLSGKKAETLAEEVGQKMAKVTTTTLKVRKEPSLKAEVLGLVPEGDILTVSKILDGWVKVSVEEGDGYVSSDYIMLYTQNTEAESKEDEEARLKKEEKERQQAVLQAEKQRSHEAKGKDNTDTNQKVTQGSNNNLGAQIAEYALQFVGNPYVYGGTSLTNGADCSGFVQSVYKKFGITLPRTSGEQGQKGSRINGLDDAKLGDLIWYSGHIGIYIGDGKLVSASNSKPYPQGGIKITNANYRPILSIRRIF